MDAVEPSVSLSMPEGGIWKFAIVVKLEAGLFKRSGLLSSPLLSLTNSAISATSHSVFVISGFGKHLTPCNDRQIDNRAATTELQDGCPGEVWSHDVQGGN